MYYGKDSGIKTKRNVKTSEKAAKTVKRFTPVVLIQNKDITQMADKVSEKK